MERLSGLYCLKIKVALGVLRHESIPVTDLFTNGSLRTVPVSYSRDPRVFPSPVILFTISTFRQPLPPKTRPGISLCILNLFMNSHFLCRTFVFTTNLFFTAYISYFLLGHIGFVSRTNLLHYLLRGKTSQNLRLL